MCTSCGFNIRSREIDQEHLSFSLFWQENGDFPCKLRGTSHNNSSNSNGDFRGSPAPFVLKCRDQGRADPVVGVTTKPFGGSGAHSQCRKVPFLSTYLR